MKIKLTQNKIAFIDNEDYQLILEYKWCASKGTNTFYATTQINIRNQDKQKNIKQRQKTIQMHRVIMENKLNRKLIPKEHIDHINHNGLDNRKKQSKNM